MIVVATLNKIRICLDPNIRTKCPFLLNQDVQAKVFSTLARKGGFFQVGLEESRSLTYKATFWTHLGRYERITLPFGISKFSSGEFKRFWFRSRWPLVIGYRQNEVEVM